MNEPRSYEVNVVAYEADGVWFAQCLEVDISAWASRIDELYEALLKEISATCAVNSHLGRQGLEGIPAAPSRFHRMWEEAAFDLKPRHPVDQARSVSIGSFGLAQLPA